MYVDAAGPHPQQSQAGHYVLAVSVLVSLRSGQSQTGFGEP